MIQITSILLIMLGLFGVLTNRNIIKIIISLNVFEIGVNIFIISIGYVHDGVAPILTGSIVSTALGFVDPLPSALVLTAIVIGVGTTALALALAKQIHNRYGTYDLDEMGVE